MTIDSVAYVQRLRRNAAQLSKPRLAETWHIVQLIDQYGPSLVIPQVELEKPLRWWRPRDVDVVCDRDITDPSITNNMLLIILNRIRIAHLHRFTLRTVDLDRAAQKIEECRRGVLPSLPSNLKIEAHPCE